MFDERTDMSEAAYNNPRSQLSARLRETDWSFTTDTTREPIHGVHPYPAKFIPAIPRELIRQLRPPDGTWVLDPFCGSGTTLVEAASEGLPVQGVDLHPLASLIARVKVTPCPSQIEGAIAHALARATELGRSSTIPDIPKLDHWFQRDVQHALAGILTGIYECDDPSTRDALKVAVSSIIVRVSNQESDTRYAAIKKSVDFEKTLSHFRHAAVRTQNALEIAWSNLVTPTPTAMVKTKNTLELSPEDFPHPVGLVITSPPYPNAYEYWLYHKYRMYWLGMDPLFVKKHEIGARPHYYKKNPHTADTFRQQMTLFFNLMSKVVIRGGYICMVIGRSIIRGELIDNADIVSSCAQSSGFSVIERVPRAVPKTRKSFNPSTSTINNEDLLIMRKS